MFEDITYIKVTLIEKDNLQVVFFNSIFHSSPARDLHGGVLQEMRRRLGTEQVRRTEASGVRHSKST